MKGLLCWRTSQGVSYGNDHCTVPRGNYRPGCISWTDLSTDLISCRVRMTQNPLQDSMLTDRTSQKRWCFTVKLIVWDASSAFWLRESALPPGPWNGNYGASILGVSPISQEIDSCSPWSGDFTFPYSPRQLWPAWEKPVILLPRGSRWMVVPEIRTLVFFDQINHCIPVAKNQVIWHDTQLLC